LTERRGAEFGPLLGRLRGKAWVRVGKNTLALLVAQVGARALNLGMVALIARGLGARGLGRYLAAMTVQAVALAVSDLGLNTYVVRELSRADGMAAGLWPSAVRLKLACALGAVLVLNVLVAPLSAGRGLLVRIVSLSLLPDAFNALATARIKARQRMEVSAGILLGIRLAYVVSGALLLWRGYDERALLAAYGGVSLLGSLAFARALSRWARLREPSSEPGTHKGWREVLGASMPFAVTGSAAILYTRADLLILSWLQGDAVAGRYGMAYRLWEAMGMIPASFLDALLPELSRQGGPLAEPGRLRALYRRAWQVMGAGAVLLSVATQLVAGPVMLVLYGRSPDTLDAVSVLRVLLLAFPFTYLYLLNGHALYAAGREQRVTVAMVIVTAVKLLSDAWAVPRWGTAGAARAALASEVLLYGCLQWLVWRSVLRLPQEGGQGSEGANAG